MLQPVELLDSRRPPGCIPAMEWFAGGTRNFGDALNYELAATVYGKRLDKEDFTVEALGRESEVQVPGADGHDNRSLRVVTMFDAVHPKGRSSLRWSPRVIAIGSVLSFARRNDIVLGAGADGRTWRWRCGTANLEDPLCEHDIKRFHLDSWRCGTANLEDPLCEHDIKRLHLNSTLSRFRSAVFAVRGPLTCKLLSLTNPRLCPPDTLFGDPALAMRFLSSRWDVDAGEQRAAMHDGSRTQITAKVAHSCDLCVVWHEFDDALKEEAAAYQNDSRVCPIDPHTTTGAVGIARYMRLSCAAVLTSSLHGLVSWSCRTRPETPRTRAMHNVPAPPRAPYPYLRLARQRVVSCSPQVFADALQLPVLVAGLSYATRFKFMDYAAGVKAPLSNQTVVESTTERITAALLRMGRGEMPPPRLSLAFLQTFALRFVQRLPWGKLCKNNTTISARLEAIRRRAESTRAARNDSTPPRSDAARPRRPEPAPKQFNLELEGFRLLLKTGSCCRRPGDAQLAKSSPAKFVTPLSCARLCSNTSRCTHFSHSRKWQDCFLCAACRPDRTLSSQLYTSFVSANLSSEAPRVQTNVSMGSGFTEVREVDVEDFKLHL